MATDKCLFFDNKQISRSKAGLYIGRKMCNCPKVTFYEVEFKLVGMKVIANHKNCGDFLNDDQFSQFEKELTKYWGFEEK